MLQRSRLIVPLDEVSHQGGGVDGGMYPFGARRPLVGLHDVADHDIDGHPIAPGVVYRHGRMLQSDYAVADHRHRLAFDLGIALGHRDRDLLVWASENFGFVSGVVNDRFVQAAEARSAIHRQVIDVERVEHFRHEVATAAALGGRILGRRLGFRGEVRLWDDLGRFPGRRLLRPGRKGRRGQGGGAGKRDALQEIAPTDNRLIKEFFTHLLLPCRDRQENRSAAQVARPRGAGRSRVLGLLWATLATQHDRFCPCCVASSRCAMTNSGEIYDERRRM